MKKEIEDEWRQILEEKKEKIEKTFAEEGGGGKGWNKVEEMEPVKTFLRIKPIEDKLEEKQIRTILILIIIAVILFFFIKQKRNAENNK